MAVGQIEALRGRLRERIEELRNRIRERIPLRTGVRGQIKVGGGELIKMATTKLDELTQKALELKPNIIPAILQAKPGERITKIVREVIKPSEGAKTQVDVGIEKEKQVVRKDISVEI